MREAPEKGQIQQQRTSTAKNKQISNFFKKRKISLKFSLHSNFSHAAPPLPPGRHTRPWSSQALHCPPTPSPPALGHRRSLPYPGRHSPFHLPSQTSIVPRHSALACRMAERIRHRCLSWMPGFKSYIGQLPVTQSIKLRWENRLTTRSLRWMLRRKGQEGHGNHQPPNFRCFLPPGWDEQPLGCSFSGMMGISTGKEKWSPGLVLWERATASHFLRTLLGTTLASEEASKEHDPTWQAGAILALA